MIFWRYKKGGPKGVDEDKFLRVGADLISLRARNGKRTDWHRGIKGCAETSANFDLEEVRPFLKRLSALVPSGFGAPQVNSLGRGIKKLKSETNSSICVSHHV